jgi:YfiH family protein
VENRSRAAGAVGLGLDQLVFAEQVHGCGVSRVGLDERGRGSRAPDDALADTDVLVTTDPEVGLVVMVADCVPIVAVDPVARVLAAVHAGWRGTTGGVVEAAVDHMVELGARPERLVVGVGPAIAADRYQVGDEVAAAVREHFGAESEAAHLVAADGHGRWLVDLWAANVVALRRAGVPAADIHVADVGTGGDFFSHRGANPCGRFAAIARLRP